MTNTDRRQSVMWACLLALISACHADVAGAQIVVGYTETAFSYTYNREVPAEIWEIRVEGSRLTVQRTEPNPGAGLPENLRVAYEVPIADLDLSRTTIARRWEIGPVEPQTMRLFCRDDAACSRVASNHSPWNGSTRAAVRFLCSSDDCARLEAALRQAATISSAERASTYQSGTPAPIERRPAAPEQALDGSKIPSRIDFSGRRTDAVPRTSDPPKVTEEKPSSSVSNSERARIPEQFDALFGTSGQNSPVSVGARPQSRASSHSDSLLPDRTSAERKVEEVTAGIFDETVKRAVSGGGRFSWSAYVLRDFLIEQVKGWGRSQAIRLKWNGELSEAGRRDAAVVEAGLTKMLKGHSYRSDVTLINRVMSLFELHEDK